MYNCNRHNEMDQQIEVNNRCETIVHIVRHNLTTEKLDSVLLCVNVVDLPNYINDKYCNQMEKPMEFYWVIQH